MQAKAKKSTRKKKQTNNTLKRNKFKRFY